MFIVQDHNCEGSNSKRSRMPLRRTRCPLITIFFLSFFLSLEMLLTCSVMATLTFEIFVIGMVGRAARVLDSSKIIGLCLLPPPNFTVQCPMNQNAEEIGLPAFGRDTFVLGRCTEAHKRGPKYVPETAAGPTFCIIVWAFRPIREPYLRSEHL